MNDLVSRQAAIDVLKEADEAGVCWKGGYEQRYSDFAEAIDCIKELPPAQPKPFGMIEHAGIEHPLSDREIIPRLMDIQTQVGGSYAIDRAIEIMESAKPIVHCRECTNWDCDYKSIINPENHYCVIMDKLMNPDDFCSYGERKE